MYEEVLEQYGTVQWSVQRAASGGVVVWQQIFILNSQPIPITVNHGVNSHLFGNILPLFYKLYEP